MNTIDGYQRLLYAIFQIRVCKKCGRRMDPDYKARKRGRICLKCIEAGVYW